MRRRRPGSAAPGGPPRAKRVRTARRSADHVEPGRLVGGVGGGRDVADVLGQQRRLRAEPASQAGHVAEVVGDPAVAVVPDRAGQGERELR